MSRGSAIRCSLLVVILAAPLQAQTAARDLPKGKELIAVYLGATTCGPCMTPAVKAAVAKANVLLSSYAKAQGYAFSAVGVAIDWSTTKGVDFLAGNGPFDQLVVGGNWTNLGVERFIWSDSTSTPAMPQILVMERTVSLGDRISLSPPRVLRRIKGGDEIPAWVASGAPVTVAAATTP